MKLKPEILLWCYLLTGRLQLTPESGFIPAEVLKILMGFISALRQVQAEVGVRGPGVKPAVWVGHDLLPLNPKHQDISA